MGVDEDGVTIHNKLSDRSLFIPIKSVFQVKRGLESYIQRFYRKAKK